MNTKQRNEMADQLEALIDRENLMTVLDVLAEVCSAKADHLRENWQADRQAKDWDRNAAVLLNAAEKARW